MATTSTTEADEDLKKAKGFSIKAGFIALRTGSSQFRRKLLTRMPKEKRAYRYEPLPNSISFRVLELLPGPWNEDIRIKLSFASWDSPPEYEAISYAWGDAKATRVIWIGKQCLQVTVSLYECLRQFRRADRPRLLWADAICINQADLKERGHQVDNMRSIYQNAARVLVWLGVDEGSACLVKEMIHAITDSCLRNTPYSFSNFNDLPLDRQIDVAERAGPWKELQLTMTEAREETALREHEKLVVTALQTFFCRPWFRRLWVMQEVNSGSEVVVNIGNIQIPWVRLGLAVLYFMKTGEWNALIPSVAASEGAWCANILYSVQLDSEVFFEFLMGCVFFQTTDPRDRIYAILSMRPLESLSLYADYTKTAVEVNIQLANAFFERLDLTPLAYVSPMTDESSLTRPSWLPDLQRLLKTQRIDQSGNASLGFEPRIEMNLEKNCLQVRGFKFDVVTQTEDKTVAEMLLFENSNPLVAHWLAERERLNVHPTGMPTLIVLAITLCSGIDTNLKPIKDLRKCFSDYMAYMRQLLEALGQPIPNGWMAGDADNWRNAADQAAGERRIFSTSKGWMGSGSRQVRAGDFVCILGGSKLPIVLRPFSRGFRVVGPAYIYGIMKGEAVSLHRGSNEDDELFQLF